MASASFRIKVDNSEKIKKLVRSALSRAIRKTAFAIQEQAATNVQTLGLIDTGAMRSSIYVETLDENGRPSAEAGARTQNPDARFARKGKSPNNDTDARVAVATEYAIYHEMGAPNAGIPARPFLRPAADQHRGTLKKLLKEEIR